MRLRQRLSLAALLVFAFLAFQTGRADPFDIPPLLAPMLLSETVPQVLIPPASFEVEDYAIEWSGQGVPDVKLELVPNSLEWVRVTEFLLLPRARLKVTAGSIQAGNVFHAKGSHTFAVESGIGTAELPLALLSGPKNPVEVSVVRNGQVTRGNALIRFKPRVAPSEPLVLVDPSCSPYGISWDSAEFDGAKWRSQWLYVSCRMVRSQGSDHKVASLETLIYWDNAGKTIKVEGADSEETSQSLWVIRLRSKPGRVRLNADGNAITLKYAAPDRIRLGFVGLGIGPYEYTFEGAGFNTHSVVPLLTLYSAYGLTDSVRIVAFDATAIHRNFYTDFGVYLVSESARFLDRRVQLNIMLGAHVIGFKAMDQSYLRFGAPQGFEVIWKDFGKRAFNASAGSFIYPEISGKTYYNIWLRWGPAKWFVEWNYIVFRERINEEKVYNRSVGLSIGFPLARFL